MILFITPTHGSELTGSYTSFIYIGYATITYETLFYAATLSLKYFTLLPFTLLFIYTTDPSEFVSSLSKLGIHYKITYAINIALRYIPDIQSEYQVIKHAQEVRGVAFEKGEASLWIRMKNRILIFWPLIIHSLERIDTVSNAMDLRGFGKKDKRTWFYTKSNRLGFYRFIYRCLRFNFCSLFKITCISRLLVSILKHSQRSAFTYFMQTCSKRDIYIMYNTNQLK